MTTEAGLFFELLNKARELKRRNIEPVIGKAILLGMKWNMVEHLEDIRAANVEPSAAHRANVLGTK